MSILSNLLGTTGLHLTGPCSALKLTPVGKPLNFNIQINKQIANATSGSIGSWAKLLNPSNKFLFKRKLSTQILGSSWVTALFNAMATGLLCRAVEALYTTVRLGGRVLFIGDPRSFEGAQLIRMNYVLNPGFGTLSILHFGDIRYYFHKWSGNVLPSKPLPMFDLAVVCVSSIDQFQSNSLHGVARLSVGTTGIQTRPDLFDFGLPPVASTQCIAQLLIDVASLAYLACNTKA